MFRLLERVVLPAGLPSEVQEPHGAGRDRDPGEPEPPAAGERAAGTRRCAVRRREQEERGEGEDGVMGNM